MPVELRKRVAKAPPPAPEPPKKKAAKAKPAPKAAEEEAAAPKKDAPAPVEEKPAAPAKTNGAAGASKKPAVGDTVDLSSFGGSVQKHSGDETTLADLASASKAGVVLFTYPKASTPGCTTQVCLFRDAYDELTAATGFAIYGLSRDSPKSNTTFATKQKLPYDLLCDPKATLISAIGLAKAGAGTQRGVFVVDKEGKVLVAEAGGPAATLAVVKKLIVEKEGGDEANGEKEDESKEKEKVEAEAEKKAEEVEEVEEKANGGATEEDKEVEKAEAEGI